MDLPVNHFKRAIASGKSPVGAWLVSSAPSTAEALGCIGFDFLVVDMEHTPIDTPQMIGILQTIAGTPAQAIVRPPWNDMVMVKRALDAGAQSLLFPFVQNAEQDKLSAGAQTCKRLGKPCGIVGANPEVVGKFLQYGFSWVAVGSDLAMLTSRAQEFLSAVRSTVAGMPRP